RSECQLSGEARDTARMSARVHVLGPEGIRQPEQALKDRSLQLPMRSLEVDRVLQRLLVSLAQPIVGHDQLFFARAGRLVRRLEVTRIGQGLGEDYVASHADPSGTRDLTRPISASGEKGLVRYSSAPAASPSARSCACPAAVGRTMRAAAPPGMARAR